MSIIVQEFSISKVELHKKSTNESEKYALSCHIFL